MNFLPDPYKGDDTVNFEIHFEGNKGEQNRNSEEDGNSTIYVAAIGVFIIALFLFFFCVCIKQYCDRRRQLRIPRQITINARGGVVAIAPGTPPPHYDELEFTSRPQISITINNIDGSTHVGDGGSSPPVHSPPPSYDALFESINIQERGSREEPNEGHTIESTSNGDEHVVLSTGGHDNNGDEQRSVEDEQHNDVDAGVDNISISAGEQSVSDGNETERPDHANNV
ncbi:uncharacterized protein [Amphiura filiformis]|uniref:uncharacterized protein n=1 Tax=Amphiura filiformis TaxID=82378 RepID=UPI003B21F2EF